VDDSVRFPQLQEVEARLPWGIFLYLLGIFVLATPYDLSHSTIESASGRTHDAYEQVHFVEKGSLVRPIALFLLGAFSIISLLRTEKNRFGVNGSLGWLILFFLIWAVLSIFWAHDTRLAVKRVMILILLSLGALAVAERLTLSETVTLALLICGTTLLTSVIAEFSLGTFRPLEASWRFAGILHPVPQGQNCGILAIAAFASCRTSIRKQSFYLAVIAIVALLFLVLTKSRMAFAAAIVSAGVYWGLVLPKPRKILTYFVLGLLVYVGAMYFILGGEISPDSVKIASFGRGEEGESSLSTFTGRIPLWEECLRYAANRPLLGYGYNTFLNQHNLIDISTAIGWVPSSPHSGYIETLLGLGLVGIGTLFLILLLALKKSIGMTKQISGYAFVVAILFWLCCNLVLEANLITRPVFPNFLCMILLAKLGFLQMSQKQMKSGAQVKKDAT